MLQRIYDLLKQGDPQAMELIYARYERSIFWIGKQTIDDEFVIESILQDTFLTLWQKRDTIERPEHMFFLLRYVMKKQCIYYYCRPRNDFYRKINSLEKYENYQDHMHGHDPEQDDEHLKDHEEDQKTFNRIKSILPLLSPERKHLIELCLTYGFQYKAIAQAMGTSITQTSNDIKKAIEDIKTIIHTGGNHQPKLAMTIKVQGQMTEEQQKVLKLRNEKQYSFASIAKELNLTQKEVHLEFMAAYKLMQLKHDQQQSA
ncbi:RNA polymerase sigma factor [Psychroflexus montanilacus]|uniref:RNA polymerase sigma factor n=1 Tax=Psychroflexus montanilacus TaxID=2873598 RepID=UPI001CCFE3FE|nr:sigma-70 family RNA polymerase sigma factor [Psychroflexus montanilacus]MBZ9651823.1 sigma-70 family RNA polymerase sigma factor [Psychroflexus montanilacus]